MEDRRQHQSPRKRRIIHRTWGQRNGPITRLVSPSDLGELIKPFVFLDYFEAQSLTASGFGWHPHSGIATITFMLSGEASYEDSTGKQGILPQGGVEWMRAGGGVWHRGGAAAGSLMQGFQLWIALPSDQELAPAESVYLPPHQVEEEGAVRVVLGRYGSAKSPIAAPPSINYLVVRLKDKEHWRFEPDVGNTVCWVAVQAGILHTDENTLASGELAIFEESDAAIDFHAEGDTTFVLGSAIKHPYDLVLGYYSVHTNPDALHQGEAEIKRLANSFGVKVACTKYSISLIRSEFLAYLCAYLCVPLRLNFQPQFATILRKAVLSISAILYERTPGSFLKSGVLTLHCLWLFHLCAVSSLSDFTKSRCSHNLSANYPYPIS